MVTGRLVLSQTLPVGLFLDLKGEYMDNNSWIKIFRKFKEWEWYKNSIVKDVFIEILLTANYEDKRWQGIEIKRGQLVTSIQSLFFALNRNSKNPDISIRNIRTALTKLKLTNELTIETTTQYTLITINKYNDYQELPNELTNKRQTTDKRLTTTKEYKKERINNTSLSASDDEITEALKPKAIITSDWQYLALDIIEKLNVPDNKKSSFFKAAKENQDLCNRCLQYAIDFPNPKIRWNMFFVKYNETKNANKNKVQ